MGRTCNVPKIALLFYYLLYSILCHYYYYYYSFFIILFVMLLVLDDRNVDKLNVIRISRRTKMQKCIKKKAKMR